MASLPPQPAQISPNSIEESVRPMALRLVQAISAAGGRALVVGGAVRDALLGGTAKDLDMEVYGLPVEKLEAAISTVAPFDAVGKSFGVYKLKNLPIDLSLPRRESKTGSGHKGFEVIGDPYMSFPEACARRDFTVNAILWDVATGEIIDPFNGRGDLQKKLLRHTSPHFVEDPLRVLRAMQFAARFQFDVAPQTVELCAQITPENLPAERLFEEWKKLLLKGVQPSLGLHFLRACGWTKYYPELHALIGCQQDPEWHPEGDVWIHTLHCLDAFAKERVGEGSLQTGGTRGSPLVGAKGPKAPNTSPLPEGEVGGGSKDVPNENNSSSPSGAVVNTSWEDLVVGFAVLLHDIGKPPTTQFIEGHWRSRAHDVVGVPIAERFLRRLTQETALIEQVLPLVECHMRPLELFKTQASDAAIRRLARKVGRIDRLVRVCHADMQGRPPMPPHFPEGSWLLDTARRLEVEASIPQPLVLGRHLIELGHTPSPDFKKILDACYEAQLDGAFQTLESGLVFLKKYLAQHPSA